MPQQNLCIRMFAMSKCMQMSSMISNKDGQNSKICKQTAKKTWSAETELLVLVLTISAFGRQSRQRIILTSCLAMCSFQNLTWKHNLRQNSLSLFTNFKSA